MSVTLAPASIYNRLKLKEGHSLAPDESCLLASVGIDIVGKYTWTNNGTTRGVGRPGRYAAMDAASHLISDQTISIPNSFTIVVVFQSSTTTGTRRLFGADTDFEVVLTSSDDIEAEIYTNVGPEFSFGNDTEWQTIAFAIDTNGSSAFNRNSKIWMNGTQRSSTSPSYTAVTDSPMSVGTRESQTNGLAGGIALWTLASRYFNDAMLRSITLDPWQIFEIRQDPAIFPAVAAAGGLTIPVAMASYRRHHLGAMR